MVKRFFLTSSNGKTEFKAPPIFFNDIFSMKNSLKKIIPDLEVKRDKVFVNNLLEEHWFFDYHFFKIFVFYYFLKKNFYHSKKGKILEDFANHQKREPSEFAFFVVGPSSETLLIFDSFPLVFGDFFCFHENFFAHLLSFYLGVEKDGEKIIPMPEQNPEYYRTLGTAPENGIQLSDIWVEHIIGYRNDDISLKIEMIPGRSNFGLIDFKLTDFYKFLVLQIIKKKLNQFSIPIKDDIFFFQFCEKMEDTKIYPYNCWFHFFPDGLVICDKETINDFELVYDEFSCFRFEDYFDLQLMKERITGNDRRRFSRYFDKRKLVPFEQVINSFRNFNLKARDFLC